MASFTQTPQNQAVASVSLPSLSITTTAGTFSIDHIYGVGAATITKTGIVVSSISLPVLSVTKITVAASSIRSLITAYLTNANCPTLMQYPLTGQRGWAAFIPRAS